MVSRFANPTARGGLGPTDMKGDVVGSFGHARARTTIVPSLASFRLISTDLHLSSVVEGRRDKKTSEHAG